MAKKRTKKTTKNSCDCSIEQRVPLGGTVHNDLLDIYFCHEHSTLELFNKRTKEKVIREEQVI